MEYIIKNAVSAILIIIIAAFLSIILVIQKPKNTPRVEPFSLDSGQVIYNDTTNIISIPSTASQEIINRAKAMAEVKWTPKHNLVDDKGHYIFIKGKTYTGIPYSMGTYQAASTSEFLSRIKDSSKLYGNDCSGFVSASWGISRQTTVTLLNAVTSGNKIDGKSVCKISWDDLKPGDAVLKESGNGKGHVVLFISRDSSNKDKINVYEQNVATLMPYQPIPTAREDVRSEKNLKKQGYIPIRLISNL